MSKYDYQFRLDISDTITVVTPRYTDTYAKSETLESGQFYYREKFEGVLTFQRDDYDLIAGADFDQKFLLYIDRKQKGEAYTLYATLSFFKTDCEFDEDSSTIRVEPKTEDRYKVLIEGMEKELDLIELSPDTTKVKIETQNLLQVYISGSNVVTNFTNGVYWEQPVQRPVGAINVLAGEIPESFFFALCGGGPFIPGQAASGGTLDPDISGTYGSGGYREGDSRYRITAQFGDVIFVMPAATLDHYDDFGSTWASANGSQYQFMGVLPGNQYAFVETSGGGAGNQSGSLTHLSGGTNTGNQTYTAWTSGSQFYRQIIRDENPPVPLTVRTVYIGDELFFTDQTPLNDIEPGQVTFRSLDDANSETKIFGGAIYMRVLTNATEISGTPTEPMPADDFVTANSKYEYCLGVVHEGFAWHDGNSDTATRWGKFQTDEPVFGGKYFEQLVFAPSTGLGTTFPIARSTWTGASLWMWYDNALTALQALGVSYTLRHAFKLSDVIKVILNKLDPSLTHEDDPAYSDFLYGDSNTIRGVKKYPILAPKSNILAGEYDKPAQRARIRFADIVRLLRDFYNAGWHITDDNKFVIEHAEYYELGTAYDTPNVGTDLTSLYEPKTAKLWAFNTKKYKYDKPEMPEQIRHKWMDNVSQPFEGYPIEITSGFVEKGNLDERSIAPFTSDIDYMHAAGDSISKSGFAFMEAVTQEGDVQFVLPFVSQTIDGIDYTMQNGYCSMIWAHEQYWRYQLPAPNIEMNLATSTALSVRKNRTQELTHPYSEADVMQLVTTALGAGKIQTQKTRLLSGRVDITLKHTTT